MNQKNKSGPSMGNFIFVLHFSKHIFSKFAGTGYSFFKMSVIILFFDKFSETFSLFF